MLLLDSHLPLSRKLLRDYAALLGFSRVLESGVKTIIIFFSGLFLGPSSKGEHNVFYKLCRKDFSYAHSGQYDCRKHIKSQFYRNIVQQASTSGNVRIFHKKNNNKKRVEDNLKWQVMAADVKMCEMIAELNLPLATADSLTHIFIGRELTNFH